MRRLKMMERARPEEGKKTEAKCATALRTLFDEPLLLQGEDGAVYQELLARVRVAVEPIDFIEEMLVAEMVWAQWEIQRWRRLQGNMLRSCQLDALENFLEDAIESELVWDDFVERLTAVLKDLTPENQPQDFAQTLVQRYMADDAAAVAKVNEMLAGSSLHVDVGTIWRDARADRARVIRQELAQGKPDAISLVNDLLARAGTSLDTMLARSLVDGTSENGTIHCDLGDIERLNRLIALAEARRNASLREIDRRRAVLGAALRRSMPKIEEASYKVIEQKPVEGRKRN
jgi:hypothetical protein